MARGLFTFFRRSEAKDDCQVAAELDLGDEIRLPGMIMKIGNGVVLFREASAYVLVRDGAKVKVLFEGGEVEGTITRSTEQGYVISSTGERLAA